MNYKRKQITPSYRRVRRKALNNKKPSYWTYGGAIAKEVVLRKEFRDFKLENRI